MSGRLDSNQRPPTPEAGALTGLRYTPNCFECPYHSRAHKDKSKIRNVKIISAKIDSPPLFFAAVRCFAPAGKNRQARLPPSRRRTHPHKTRQIRTAGKTTSGGNGNRAIRRRHHAGACRRRGSSGTYCNRHTRRGAPIRGCGTARNGFATRPRICPGRYSPG